MNRFIAGLLAVVLGVALVRADSINIPAPSWSYLVPASVQTALQIAVGSAGGPVTNGGALGTPSSGTATNLNGTAASLTAGNVTTNANSTGDVTSVGNATTIVGTVGSWSPTLIGSSTAGTGQTYSTQVGSYEKLGRQVTIRFTIVVTSLGTAAGNLQISNLPFTPTSTTSDNGTCFIAQYSVSALAALSYGLTGSISAGTTVISLLENGNTASNNLTVSQAGGSSFFIGMCSYRT